MPFFSILFLTCFQQAVAGMQVTGMQTDEV